MGAATGRETVVRCQHQEQQAGGTRSPRVGIGGCVDTALIVISKAQPVGSGSPQRGEMPGKAPAMGQNLSCFTEAAEVFNHTRETMNKQPIEFMQDLANARLIAAAPQLLEALKAVTATEMFLPDHPQRQAAYKAARAAIYKATQ